MKPFKAGTAASYFGAWEIVVMSPQSYGLPSLRVQAFLSISIDCKLNARRWASMTQPCERHPCVTCELLYEIVMAGLLKQVGICIFLEFTWHFEGK